MDITLFFFPHEVDKQALANSTAVVIDVLRMTSSAIQALSNGCSGIYPVETVEEAHRLGAQDPGLLLGGERGGVLIPGFNLGNSPLEYTSQAVAGRSIVVTTTNGTRAILAAHGAQHVLLGALINAAALAYGVRHAQKLVFVCAGTHDRYTMEDVLAAGAIMARLEGLGVTLAPEDAALSALLLYRSAKDRLVEVMAQTKHYRFLDSLGEAQRADNAFCLREDTHQVVPQVQAGWIRAKPMVAPGKAP